jgi:hypothetical protein
LAVVAVVLPIQVLAQLEFVLVVLEEMVIYLMALLVHLVLA